MSTAPYDVVPLGLLVLFRVYAAAVAGVLFGRFAPLVCVLPQKKNSCDASWRFLTVFFFCATKKT